MSRYHGVGSGPHLWSRIFEVCAVLPGPLVFVDIDTQRDFMDCRGTLPVAGASEIRRNLARLTSFARANGIPVLATACAHALDDPDPEPFAPHCLIGTPGQERIPETAWSGGVVVLRDGGYSDDMPAHLTLYKRHYDAFTHPDAERIVARYNRDRPTFVVYGVATDYCVRANALGLLDRGCRVAVVADAVRAVVPEHESRVLTELVHRGALLVLCDTVVGDGMVVV